MKILKHDPTGGVYVANDPEPVSADGILTVDMDYIWISSGTETSILKNLRKNGTKDTKHYPLGYTGSGVVKKAAGRFKVGDRVAVYGSPYVFAAETIVISPNLAVPLPSSVTLYEAAAVGLGAIALHGLRRINVTLGDVVVQVGLGGLGQIAAQLTEAHGAEFIGVDLVANRARIAKECLKGYAGVTGSINLAELVADATRGRGADALVLCVTGQAPIADETVALLRDRGRVCLLGGTKDSLPGLDVAHRRELEYRFVRAGGPGRYDPVYEAQGIDYPVGYVQWTENRNMEAVIRTMASGKLNVKPLITHVFPIDQGPAAYEMLLSDPDKTLGMLIAIRGNGTDVPKRGDLS